MQISAIGTNQFRVMRSLKLGGDWLVLVIFARIASLCVGSHLATLHENFFHQDFGQV